jgi:hypothetical protein
VTISLRICFALVAAATAWIAVVLIGSVVSGFFGQELSGLQTMAIMVMATVGSLAVLNRVVGAV